MHVKQLNTLVQHLVFHTVTPNHMCVPKEESLRGQGVKETAGDTRFSFLYGLIYQYPGPIYGLYYGIQILQDKYEFLVST